MNCPDTRAKLNDYVDGALAPADMRSLEAHVAGCAKCRAELDALRALQAATAGLEKEITPARDLWRDIAPHLDAERIGTESPEDPGTGSDARARARSLFRHGWHAVAPVALAASIALLIVFLERNAPLAGRTAGWTVAAVEGAPRIGQRDVAGEGRLRVGEWLETDGSSRARVAVAEIGEVNLDRNSRLRLVGTSETSHRVELARGQLSAFIYAPPRIFFVETPSATAVDLGCFYTLAVDDHGNGELHVTAGYVALEHGGRESIVPAGWKCRTRKGAGPGTPFAADAPDPLRAALERFDFGPARSPAALPEVLAHARADDTITLWHLLSRTDRAGRAAVFDVLARLEPPPAGVTRAGVIAGDPAMRRAWGDALGIGGFSTR